MSVPEKKVVTPKKVYLLCENNIENLCRLCGSAEKGLIKIYTKIGPEKLLGLKITKARGIDLHQNQLLSSSICRNCELFVNKMWNFCAVNKFN